MDNESSSKRVFVGLKVSDFIAKECVKLQADLGDLPARFIPPKDLHVTLLAPWEMSEQSEVVEKIHTALQSTQRFTLKLNHLSYGPGLVKPGLAWIECSPAKELIALHQELLQAFAFEQRIAFKPHVTIARFKKEHREFLRLRPIDKPIALSMQVTSVELFQSPRIGGRGYIVLASLPIPLNKIPG